MRAVEGATDVASGEADGRPCEDGRRPRSRGPARTGRARGGARLPEKTEGRGGTRRGRHGRTIRIGIVRTAWRGTGTADTTDRGRVVRSRRKDTLPAALVSNVLPEWISWLCRVCPRPRVQGTPRKVLPDARRGHPAGAARRSTWGALRHMGWARRRWPRWRTRWMGTEATSRAVERGPPAASEGATTAHRAVESHRPPAESTARNT